MPALRTTRYGDGARGNALFLVLLAVVMFALLAFAVTQTGRGTGDAQRETAEVAGSQAVQYPALLHSIITRMVVTGVAATTITFTYPGTGQPYEVFDQAGGAATQQPAPAGIGGTATAWGYQDVSSSPTDGYYVKDVATNANVTGREALAYLHDISLAACRAINRGLDIPAAPATAAHAITWGAPLATYNVGAANTISGAGIDGHAYACVLNGATYDYYHALIEQ
jgi:hypothetical protein